MMSRKIFHFNNQVQVNRWQQRFLQVVALRSNASVSNWINVTKYMFYLIIKWNVFFKLYHGSFFFQICKLLCSTFTDPWPTPPDTQRVRTFLLRHRSSHQSARKSSFSRFQLFHIFQGSANNFGFGRTVTPKLIHSLAHWSPLKCWEIIVLESLGSLYQSLYILGSSRQIYSSNRLPDANSSIRASGVALVQSSGSQTHDFKVINIQRSFFMTSLGILVPKWCHSRPVVLNRGAAAH